MTLSPWHAFEAIRTLVAFPVVWRKEIGDQFPAFRNLCLQPSDYEALSYPCPLQCGCRHRIIPRHDGSAAIAACRCDPPGCPDLELTLEEITPLELNSAKLGRAICQALLLNSKSGQIGLPFTSQIGSWSAGAVPVFLTIQSDPEVFQLVVSDLAACLKQPFILLAPTSNHLHAHSRQILTGVRAGFFSLETSVRISALGSLHPLKPPGELFRSFTPQPPELDQDSNRKAFALVRALDSDNLKPPSPITVFRLYCTDGLNISKIASACRCSRDTVRSRLALIRAKTGVAPELFRATSGHLEKIVSASTDPRARHIHRQRLIDDNGT